jgi:hypothetical protein
MAEMMLLARFRPTSILKYIWAPIPFYRQKQSIKVFGLDRIFLIEYALLLPTISAGFQKEKANPQ